nr:MAG TPA: hypothetical protein [Caudoviricetes sp.]
MNDMWKCLKEEKNRRKYKTGGVQKKGGKK